MMSCWFRCSLVGAIGMFALLACGTAEEEASPETQVGLLDPGSFQILPREEAIAMERFDPKSGSFERLGLPLRAHLAEAWGLTTRELHLQVELPDGVFDVRVRPEDGKRETAEALIRGGLSEHFDLVVERRNWQGDVLSLRLTGEGLVPEPVESRGEVASDVVRRAGEYRVAAAPISDLVAFLNSFSPTPVVDGTGLDAHYDLLLEWDVSQGGRALRAALADAGFQLERERGELRRWVVRPRR